MSTRPPWLVLRRLGREVDRAVRVLLDREISQVVEAAAPGFPTEDLAIRVGGHVADLLVEEARRRTRACGLGSVALREVLRDVRGAFLRELRDVVDLRLAGREPDDGIRRGIAFGITVCAARRIDDVISGRGPAP